jgi:hypothetical protein
MKEVRLALSFQSLLHSASPSRSHRLRGTETRRDVVPVTARSGDRTEPQRHAITGNARRRPGLRRAEGLRGLHRRHLRTKVFDRIEICLNSNFHLD